MGDYHRFEDDTPHFLESGERQHHHQTDLDKFLAKVYDYYVGKGFSSIVLSRSLNLISLLWTAALVTLLTMCIDYDVLFTEFSLPKALVYKGSSPFYALCLVIFCFYWMFESYRFIIETRANLEIRHFYEEELKISAEDLKTIEWKEVSRKIIKVPRLCLVKETMTHLDVVNRIMRQDNYMIALINKDVLRLRLPIPFLRDRSYITQTLEWSLNRAIFRMVFDRAHGDGINPDIKDASKSPLLANQLRTRFRLLGFAAFLFSPFIFAFLLIQFIFQHGERLRSDPTNISSRQWSPLARWKIRGLNELPHLLQRRLHKSYEPAEKYVNSFPYPSLAILARFVSFVVGSLIVIIIGLSLWNDEALRIEILGDFGALWFLGVGGSILALCRVFIPNETSVFEPKRHMGDVVEYTHYLPEHWKDKENTYRVMQEFAQLFQYKLVILVIEILSVLFAPFILFFSLPKCADDIVFFFRDKTVHEHGVGDICRYARFHLEEDGNPRFGVTSSSSRGDQTNDGKMETSFINFKVNYPDWQPSDDGERYISRLEQSMSSHFGSDPLPSRTRSMGDSPFGLSSLSSSFANDREPPLESLGKINRFLCESSIRSEVNQKFQ